MICPNCQLPNAPDVKFCENCGQGLTRLCPECERENSIHTKFCGGCGTDVEGFAQSQETLQRMQAYTGEKRWSRVVKEHDLLPKELRLNRKKGKSLLGEIGSLHQQAREKLEKRKQLREQIEAAHAANEYAKTLKLIPHYQEIDPHNQEINALVGKVEMAVEAQGILDLYLGFEEFHDAKQYDEAMVAGEQVKKRILALEQPERYTFEVSDDAGQLETKTLADLLNELGRLQQEIDGLASKADGLERKAAEAEQAGDPEEAERLLADADAFYSCQNPCRESLARVRTRIRNERISVDDFQKQVAQAGQLFEQKRLSACRAEVTRLRKLRSELTISAKAGWRAEFERAGARLAELAGELTAREEALGNLIWNAEEALAQQDYERCRELCLSIKEVDAQDERTDALLASADSAQQKIGKWLAEARQAYADGDWDYAEVACAEIEKNQRDYPELDRLRSQIQTARLAERRRKHRRNVAVLVGGFVLILGIWTGFQLRYLSRRKAFCQAVELQKVDEAVQLAGLIHSRYRPAAEFLKHCFETALGKGQACLAQSDWQAAASAFQQALRIEGFADAEIRLYQGIQPEGAALVNREEEAEVFDLSEGRTYPVNVTLPARGGHALYCI
jgi:hypothetical protein